MKLISQIQAIIFLACPVEERERGERGRQMAKYLRYNGYYEVMAHEQLIHASVIFVDLEMVDICFL